MYADTSAAPRRSPTHTTECPAILNDAFWSRLNVPEVAVSRGATRFARLRTFNYPVTGGTAGPGMRTPPRTIVAQCPNHPISVPLEGTRFVEPVTGIGWGRYVRWGL